MPSARRPVALLVLSAVAALLATLLTTGASTAAAPSPASSYAGSSADSYAASYAGAVTTREVAAASVAAAARTRREGRARPWRPRAGVVFNNPLGDRRERRRIVRQVILAIEHTPRRGEIRIASWNVRNNGIFAALRAAHQRGATVRVIMSRGNMGTADDPNPGLRRLVRELAQHGNRSRRPARRSHVKACVSSCRGRSGISHSKFFLFSRAGAARHVVMNGSFNATDLASSNQWNDLYTVRGKRGVYDAFRDVFSEMWRDRPVEKAYLRHRFGPVTAFFYPYTGTRSRQPDPALAELRAVRCRGARNTASGRTKVRVAMTSWFGDRGTRLAWRVRHMQNHGCDIKVVYAVMGNEVLRILRREGRRPVRLQQVVQDFDGDGVYDRYLHMKVLTVKGHYRGDRSAWVTVNGSANWSPAVLNSDEAVLRIRRRPVLRDYNRRIEQLFRNPPPTGLIGMVLGRRVAATVPLRERVEAD